MTPWIPDDGVAVGDGVSVEAAEPVVVVAGVVVVPLDVVVAPETGFRGVLVALAPDVEDAVRVEEPLGSATLAVSQTTS